MPNVRVNSLREIFVLDYSLIVFSSVTADWLYLCTSACWNICSLMVIFIQLRNTKKYHQTSPTFHHTHPTISSVNHPVKWLSKYTKYFQLLIAKYTRHKWANILIITLKSSTLPHYPKQTTTILETRPKCARNKNIKMALVKLSQYAGDKVQIFGKYKNNKCWIVRLLAKVRS